MIKKKNIKRCYKTQVLGEPVMNKSGKIPCPDGASVLGQALAVDGSDTWFFAQPASEGYIV